MATVYRDYAVVISCRVAERIKKVFNALNPRYLRKPYPGVQLIVVSRSEYCSVDAPDAIDVP